MEQPTKRARSDKELRTLLGSFQILGRDVIYKILLESGLSVIDVNRMCTLNETWSHHLCTDAFWDKLYIDRFLAKRKNMTEADRGPYYKNSNFLEWKRERAEGMTNNYAHILYSLERKRYEDRGVPKRDLFLRGVNGDSVQLSNYIIPAIKYTRNATDIKEIDENWKPIQTMLQRLFETDSIVYYETRKNQDYYHYYFQAPTSMHVFDKFVYNAFVAGWTNGYTRKLADVSSCALCSSPLPPTMCANCDVAYCGQSCADTHYIEHEQECIGSKK